MVRVFIAAILAAAAHFACAQSWPARPLHIVVPYAPGGPVDLSARLLAPKLQQAVGQPVVVENKPGAGGNIGADFVAKSAPDGHTLVMGAIATHAINPALYPKFPYDPIRDFRHIALIVQVPNVLVVNNELPAKSVAELIALAKTRPGKLDFASGSSGSTGHLAGELFKQLTATYMVHIPYKGSAPALTAVMSGETQLMFGSPGGSMSHVNSGRLRALAVGSEKPSALAPGLPTMTEAGVPGFVSEAVHVVLAPAATPPAIVSRLHQEIDRFVQSADGKSQFLKGGVEAASSSPEGLVAMMKSEMATIGKVLKAAGVNPP